MPHSLSARNDTVCNALGAAIFALLGALPARADAPPAARADTSAAAPSNNYPTLARIEYVQECINRAGGAQSAMYQCACAIDRIAERLTYDEFVEASTYAKYSTLPGEAGGIFRDTDDAKKKAKLFRAVEGDAYRACLVPRPRS